jgi:hypothetical protein
MAVVSDRSRSQTARLSATLIALGTWIAAIVLFPAVSRSEVGYAALWVLGPVLGCVAGRICGGWGLWPAALAGTLTWMVYCSYLYDLYGGVPIVLAGIFGLMQGAFVGFVLTGCAYMVEGVRAYFSGRGPGNA